MAGHDSNERGRMDIEEVIAQYDAPKIVIAEPSIPIIDNKQYQRGMSADALYQITRKHWKIGRRRTKAKYALAVYNSIVRQMYEIRIWYPSDVEPNRWVFDGEIAADKQYYVGGSVVDYVTLGAQNPIRLRQLLVTLVMSENGYSLRSPKSTQQTVL